VREEKPGAIDRREFLKTIGRFGALGALSLLGIKALSGLFSGSAGDGGRIPNQSCRSDGICPRCPVSADCGLPQALSFKQGTGRT
jgi:hypothetical protein